MPKLASFSIGLDYSQMCIYDPSLEFPGNDWDDQHVDQGFTWRPFSVSFRTIGSDDDCDIEIWDASEISIQPNAVRAIVVPFSVPMSGSIVITGGTSVVPEHELKLPSDEYALVFEYGLREEYWQNPEYQEPDALFIPTWSRLTFIPDRSVEPRILRADSDLSPSYPLLMEARPA
ncbi:MAG: competence protein ComJ [Myxacorys californica WJT36-NPBG1]|jgi:hypothetical protein|nr:competence protein ComJ [Myxacorys californica WJT36-NPBG1]